MAENPWFLLPRYDCYGAALCAAFFHDVASRAQCPALFAIISFDLALLYLLLIYYCPAFIPLFIFMVVHVVLLFPFSRIWFSFGGGEGPLPGPSPKITMVPTMPSKDNTTSDCAALRCKYGGITSHLICMIPTFFQDTRKAYTPNSDLRFSKSSLNYVFAPSAQKRSLTTCSTASARQCTFFALSGQG